MTGFMGNAYLWMKAAHIIFVIFWMAGLFMLPRFLVYHQEAESGSDEEQRWVDRESRLRRIILNPSLVIVWVLGLALTVNGGHFSEGWLHAKLLLVVGAVGYHHACRSLLGKFEQLQNRRSERWFRVFNEVTVLLFALIVVLVVVKPF